MAAPDPIRETRRTLTFTHGNKAFSEKPAFIIEPKKQRMVTEGTTKQRAIDLLHADIEEFKSVWRSAAKPTLQQYSAAEKQNGIWVLNAINPEAQTGENGQKRDDANGSRDTAHIHSFPIGLSEKFSHVTDPNLKSYVPAPSPQAFQDFITEASEDTPDDMFAVALNEEARFQHIIINKRHKTFQDFAGNASEDEWTCLQQEMQNALSENQNGARFVIRNGLTNSFFMEMLGGENLAQKGTINPKNDGPGRWFDAVLENN